MSFLASAIMRGIPGAFIANSGIGKLSADAETSAGLQQFAATGIPAVKKLPKDQFAKILGGAEVALGGALLSPFVSNKLAGTALTAFGAGLLSMYFRNDNMTLSDGIRPSEEGLALSKDSWLVALGAGLIAMDASEDISKFGAKRKLKKAEKKQRKAEKKLTKFKGED